jgi:hypothetical protein
VSSTLCPPSLWPVSNVLLQAPGLDITEVDDGLVVFEPNSRRVHHLNVTATLVFELCTGENDRDAIVQVVQSAFGLAEPPADEIDALLASLRAESLVVAASTV